MERKSFKNVKIKVRVIFQIKVYLSFLLTVCETDINDDK